MNIQEMFRANTKYFRPIQNCAVTELAGFGNFPRKSFRRLEWNDPGGPAAIIRETRTNRRPEHCARAIDCFGSRGALDMIAQRADRAKPQRALRKGCLDRTV